MHDNNDAYLECIRSRANRVFYRTPYPGNAGDSLIQFATKQLLDDLHIRTTVDPREAGVILIPGGNPTMWPSIGPERWQTLWARFPQAEFIVGPAGFRHGYTDWAHAVNIAGNVVSGLFARDPDSLENLASAGLRPDIKIALSHDPALYLRNSAWMAMHRRAATEEYDLAAFRDDYESNLDHGALRRSLFARLPGRIHNVLIRLSAHAVRRRKHRLVRRLVDNKCPILESDVSRQRFEVFVEIIRAARTVHTDRLHVMLMAAMLGKKVFAYPTSHNKLEGVYHHSLADWTDVAIVAM